MLAVVLEARSVLVLRFLPLPVKAVVCEKRLASGDGFLSLSPLSWLVMGRTPDR